MNPVWEASSSALLALMGLELVLSSTARYDDLAWEWTLAYFDRGLACVSEYNRPSRSCPSLRGHCTMEQMYTRKQD